MEDEVASVWAGAPLSLPLFFLWVSISSRIAAFDYLVAVSPPEATPPLFPFFTAFPQIFLCPCWLVVECEEEIGVKRRGCGREVGEGSFSKTKILIFCDPILSLSDIDVVCPPYAYYVFPCPARSLPFPVPLVTQPPPRIHPSSPAESFPNSCPFSL